MHFIVVFYVHRCYSKHFSKSVGSDTYLLTYWLVNLFSNVFILECSVEDVSSGTTTMMSDGILVAKDTETCIQTRDYSTGGPYHHGDTCNYIIKVRNRDFYMGSPYQPGDTCRYITKVWISTISTPGIFQHQTSHMAHLNYFTILLITFVKLSVWSFHAIRGNYR